MSIVIGTDEVYYYNWYAYEYYVYFLIFLAVLSVVVVVLKIVVTRKRRARQTAANQNAVRINASSATITANNPVVDYLPPKYADVALSSPPPAASAPKSNPPISINVV